MSVPTMAVVVVVLCMGLGVVTSADAETGQTVEALAAGDGFVWTSGGWMRPGDTTSYRWTGAGWVRSGEDQPSVPTRAASWSSLRRLPDRGVTSNRPMARAPGPYEPQTALQIRNVPRPTSVQSPQPRAQQPWLQHVVPEAPVPGQQRIVYQIPDGPFAQFDPQDVATALAMFPRQGREMWQWLKDQKNIQLDRQQGKSYSINAR